MMTACGRVSLEELSNGALLGQIEFLMRADNEILESLALERSEHGRAHQAAVTSNVYPRILSQFHGPTRGGCKL